MTKISGKCIHVHIPDVLGAQCGCRLLEASEPLPVPNSPPASEEEEEQKEEEQKEEDVN